MDQNGQSVSITNGMIERWMGKMWGGPVPRFRLNFRPANVWRPENKWYKVPDEHLHSGMVVAHVNFVEFMQQIRMNVLSPGPARPDGRPLITPQLRELNQEEWDRLWNLNRTEECPVCHEKPDIWTGPMNSDVPTRCTHWACVGCWDQIADRDQRCPICRDDLSEWLSGRVDASTDNASETES